MRHAASPVRVRCTSSESSRCRHHGRWAPASSVDGPGGMKALDSRVARIRSTTMARSRRSPPTAGRSTRGPCVSSTSFPSRRPVRCRSCSLWSCSVVLADHPADRVEDVRTPSSCPCSRRRHVARGRRQPGVDHPDEPQSRLLRRAAVVGREAAAPCRTSATPVHAGLVDTYLAISRTEIRPSPPPPCPSRRRRRARSGAWRISSNSARWTVATPDTTVDVRSDGASALR